METQQNYPLGYRWNMEVIGVFGMNLWPFSFGRSVRPLNWSPQPWESIIKIAFNQFQ